MEHFWFRETYWSIVMMRKMMSPPILPVEDEVHNKEENACDFEEEDVLKYFR